MRLLGVDLAWKDGSDGKPANETGVVALEPSGEIAVAGWTIGLEETFEWGMTHRATSRPDRQQTLEARR